MNLGNSSMTSSFLWVHDSLAVPPSCLKRELLNNFIALRLSLIPSSLISTLWASDTSPRIKPNRAIKKDLTASRKGIHIQHPPPYASCLNDWNWVFLNWESDSGWPIGVPVHREARHPARRKWELPGISSLTWISSLSSENRIICYRIVSFQGNKSEGECASSSYEERSFMNTFLSRYEE